MKVAPTAVGVVLGGGALALWAFLRRRSITNVSLPSGLPSDETAPEETATITVEDLVTDLTGTVVVIAASNSETRLVSGFLRVDARQKDPTLFGASTSDFAWSEQELVVLKPGESKRVVLRHSDVAVRAIPITIEIFWNGIHVGSA